MWPDLIYVLILNGGRFEKVLLVPCKRCKKESALLSSDLCHVRCACMAGQKTLIKFYFFGFLGGSHGVFARDLSSCVPSPALFFRLLNYLQNRPIAHLNDVSLSSRDHRRTDTSSSTHKPSSSRRLSELEIGGSAVALTIHLLDLYLWSTERVLWFLTEVTLLNC